MDDRSGWFFAHDTDVQKHNSEEAKGAQVWQDVNTDNSWQPSWYPDQIPPFDIVLTAANEYGHVAQMSLRGVEILNEGSGMSIDDIVTEQQMTFVAREINPWKASSTTNNATNVQ
jgi:hypothetical protein